MPVFIYNAIEKNGRVVSGQIRSQSLESARRALKIHKIDPISIKEKAIFSFFSKRRKVKTSVVLFFTRQLSFLLEAGVSLIQALEMSISNSSSPAFKEALVGIKGQLEGGRSFSKCLQIRRDIFDDFYINMIVCAEETGLLDQVLKDLADYMEKVEMIKSRVKSAMMYPIVVLVVSFLIIMGLIIFIVPRFSNMYGDKGLPALTQALVSLSDMLRNNPMPFIGFFLGAPLLIYQYSKTSSGTQNIRSFARSLPLFGEDTVSSRNGSVF